MSAGRWRVRRHVIAVALVAGSILVACGDDGPTAGTVVDREYDDADDVFVPGVYVPGSCTSTGKVTTCRPAVFVPPYWRHEDERWRLRLDDGEHVGWRTVDRATFDRCRDGEWCDVDG